MEIVSVSLVHHSDEPNEPDRNLDQFDMEEFKVDDQLIKIQNNAFHLKYPIVVGQRGECYQINRCFDEGSFGRIYHASQLKNNFQLLRKESKNDLVIKVFDVRN